MRKAILITLVALSFASVVYAGEVMDVSGNSTQLLIDGDSIQQRVLDQLALQQKQIIRMQQQMTDNSRPMMRQQQQDQVGSQNHMTVDVPSVLLI